MSTSTRQQKTVKKPPSQEKHRNEQSDKGETFKNICLGIAAIGCVILSYLQFFI